MIKMLEVFKGNSSDRITITAENVDFTDANWTAKCHILDPDTNADAMTAKDMTKAVGGLSFYTQLTPTDTGALAVKKYTIAIIIVNNVLAFKKDVYDELNIRKSLIA
jgi:hypothetical protein